MIQITVAVDGMQCGMCEAHVNDAVRNHFKVKKVKSSHSKGTTVIVAEDDIPDEALKDAISQTGYTVGAISREPYKKRGLFK